MRHEKAEQLLKLCVLLSGRAEGMTLDDIAETFEVSRRTAERMRDAATRLLPDVEEWIDVDGRKRWRSGKLPAPLGTVTAQELIELSAAAHALRAQGRGVSADTIDVLADKLRASQGRQAQLRLETDLELLMESEGLALRPGPRVQLQRDQLETVRTAILGSRRLAGRYRGRARGTERSLMLEPHGVLYGTRPFLVAREAGKKDLRHYRLQAFGELELTTESFERISDFDIAAYSRSLFGTFQEPSFDVVWRFRPAAAFDASGYVFHPDQTVETAVDGALVVRFRAGGALEMAWHLATWGDAVDVLEPQDFWERAGASRARLVDNATRPPAK